ncbi:chemotaxis-related protein WspB [Novosphingobium sp. SG751A]|uniref:chemotaxis protein CheW n=1 Tax=Novosphingobium sp. SG751A TaxID=2587000 RepID=UPI0015565EB7|nr:chemotaxis protein CheW [Novosphingobium sp. SG751A]NOW45752.1 chemotaxis-related protein WspB [Novosphingobium sp. SG751A]
MLFLHFRIGEGSFALAADRIVEIVPLAPLRTIRQGPDTADVPTDQTFEYRGQFVPVIDLCQIDLGRPARRRLSTRIIVVGHHNALLGLIAENATTMLRLEPEDFAPFATGPEGLIQRVDLPDLLPPEMLDGALRIEAHP